MLRFGIAGPGAVEEGLVVLRFGIAGPGAVEEGVVVLGFGIAGPGAVEEGVVVLGFGIADPGAVEEGGLQRHHRTRIDPCRLHLPPPLQQASCISYPGVEDGGFLHCCC